jgi:hypothetical protein
MFSQNSGIRCLWPDRLQSSNYLFGMRSSIVNIGTILRSFSHFGAMSIGKFCANVGITILAGAPILFSANTALATPSYVQGNYAVPQTPQTKVTLPYTATQAATDLNVVVVGWNDSTAQISSVTDTAGNIYQLAVGPTLVSGILS